VIPHTDPNHNRKLISMAIILLK